MMQRMISPRRFRQRLLTLAVVFTFAAPAAPALAQESTPGWRNKEKVLALAKKIDAHIAAAQAKAEVKPLGPADPSTFFRRLHLDMVGKIPTLIDIADWVDDGDPDKLWDWIDRLGCLDGPTYGRHFASVFRAHILTGANQQGQTFGPPLEGWLRERLEAGTGYDAIVRDLLAPRAEMMQNNSASPAAFYIGAENKPENLAGAASRVFLGVKIECAQCHAHPTAEWSRKQFWEFAAFFAGTQQNFNRFQPNGVVQAPPPSTVRELKIPGSDDVVKAKFLTGEEPKWKTDEPTRNVLANWMTSRQNPYFAKATADFVFSYFFGVSLLEPIIEPSDDSPITHPELLDDMARAFVEENFDLKFLIRAIIHTDAYQRASAGGAAPDKDDYVLFTRMPVRGLSPEQLYDSFIEATMGPGGHAEPNYAPQNFNFRQPGNIRAEFLSRFASTERRHESQTSILQALFMMNGNTVAEKLRNNSEIGTIATRTVSTEQRLRTLFLMTLSRPPRPAEMSRLTAYVNEGGPDQRERLGDIYWALLNSAEFRLNH
jgi:hypothetical protein